MTHPWAVFRSMHTSYEFKKGHLFLGSKIKTFLYIQKVAEFDIGAK